MSMAPIVEGTETNSGDASSGLDLDVSSTVVVQDLDLDRSTELDVTDPSTEPSPAAPTPEPKNTVAGDITAGLDPVSEPVSEVVPGPDEFELQRAAIHHAQQILKQRPEIGAVCPVIEDNSISIVSRKPLPGDDKPVTDGQLPLYMNVRRGLLSNVEGLVVPAVGIWVQAQEYHIDETGVASNLSMDSLEHATCQAKQLRAMGVSRDIVPGTLATVADAVFTDGLEAAYSIGDADALGEEFEIITMSDDGVEVVVHFKTTDEYLVFGRMEPLAAQRVVEETYTTWGRQRRTLMQAHIEKMIASQLSAVQTTAANNIAMYCQLLVDMYHDADDAKLETRETPKEMTVHEEDFCQLDVPGPVFKKRTCPSVRSQLNTT